MRSITLATRKRPVDPERIERMVSGIVRRLESLIAMAMDSIPACPGEQNLRELVRLQALRLAPKRLLESAAA